MYILLKLDYAKLGVSNLILSKVIEEKPLRDRLDPSLGKGRVNHFMSSTTRGHLLKRVFEGLTLFRSNFSKFLSTLGSIFQVFCPLQVHF